MRRGRRRRVMDEPADLPRYATSAPGCFWPVRGHDGHHGHPRGRPLKKSSPREFSWVFITPASQPSLKKIQFQFRGGHGGHGGHDMRTDLHPRPVHEDAVQVLWRRVRDSPTPRAAIERQRARTLACLLARGHHGHHGHPREPTSKKESH